MNIQKSKEKTKILIVNVHSSENAGDLALLQQTIFYLQSAYENVDISISSNWPNEEPLRSLDYKIIPSPWFLVSIPNLQ